MSFFSSDTFERSVSKTREKERKSTVSHKQSSDSEAEQAKKGGLLEQHHQDMEIEKHSSNEESEVTKVARQEAPEYCRDKLIIKPKKIPHDQKQQKISQGITKQRSDYPTMEDICSDWESYDETEQMTQQSKTKANRESKKSILQQNQTSKESPLQLHHHQQQQQQQPLQYHQSAQYNQQVHHYQTPQNHYQIKQCQLPKTTNLVRPKNESIEKQQSKKKSNL
ncbi:unnamed protein product [Cercopithifilaria johnstoni]|uniref:Uncharacterized protein n=1 Tax=Cercopithifilaria johnstoni TaxID=2874296 RepID=A0A8J2M619_9BILA|nr:unnamed protein product [Cercopithifilaria johnstoni]